ncbi:MAG: OmpA family protein [Myxococcota bacterium]
MRSAPRLNFEIHFQKNTADLTSASCLGLDALGTILQKEHLSAQFTLGGHTDMDGTPSVNGPLSQARAESARDYLVENYGIDPERLEARGYGMSEPLHPLERSLREKQVNRRVDLRLRRF